MAKIKEIPDSVDQKIAEQYKIVFRNNDIALTVLADLVSDLFMIDNGEFDLASRANKARIILSNLGIIEYVGCSPTLESIKKLLEKIIV